MSQESEMNKEYDRDNRSVYSGHPCVQKYEEIWIKQGKLEWRNDLKLFTNDLKQKFGEFCEKYKITACPEEELLPDNSKEGSSLREISSNLTNNILDCEEKIYLECQSLQYSRHFLNKNNPFLKMSFHFIHTLGPQNILASHLLSFV